MTEMNPSKQNCQKAIEIATRLLKNPTRTDPQQIIDLVFLQEFLRLAKTELPDEYIFPDEADDWEDE